jgi:hypothetical protein
MKQRRVLWFFPLILVAGCGGTSNVVKSSTVSGTVLDIDNQPVRDAVVSSRFGSTRTSTTGAFVLPKQGNGAVEYTAEITRNGVRYRGRTMSFNFKNDRTQSVNIVVGQEDELGIIRGQVEDRNGNLLQDASVYAYNGAGSSMRAFSDSNGNYEFRDLVGGVTYTVLAGGQGFRSDSSQISLGLSDERTANFVLDDPGTPALDPPQNAFATSWVSPSDATRQPGGSNAYEAIKMLVDPKYKSRKSVSQTRAVGSTLVEVDLEWDEQRFPDLQGYGIYRGNGANGSVAGIDFLPEPLAAFYVDQSVQTRSTYSYALTTISALYPDFPNETESGLSTRIVATTLDKLSLANPTFGPLTFRWLAGSGADDYIVFLFDEFPGIGVTSIWNNAANPATGTSVVYNGNPLQAGGTYYYVVVGLANNDESRTISQIGSFKL